MEFYGAWQEHKNNGKSQNVHTTDLGFQDDLKKNLQLCSIKIKGSHVTCSSSIAIFILKFVISYKDYYCEDVQ